MTYAFQAAWKKVRCWFDKDAFKPPTTGPEADRVDWLRVAPFLAMHVACLAVLWVGWSWTAVGVAVALYFVRMFAVTAFYHRYFAHKTFRATRFMQFLFGVLGATAAQRGPLWWAAHHRRHHQHSDTAADAHSPHAHGWLYSHMLWFCTPRHYPTDEAAIRDLMRYPELRFLDRRDMLVPVLLAVGLYGTGVALDVWVPSLGVTGMQLFIWGFCISTVVLFHAVCSINSVAHLLGRRPYPTGDHSRNSLLLALITLGEGWHNNHHYYPATVRQGFRWYEVDITWYVLNVMSWLGLVSDLRGVPARIVASRGLPRHPTTEED